VPDDSASPQSGLAAGSDAPRRGVWRTAVGELERSRGNALLVRTTFEAAKGPRLTVLQRIARGGEPIASARVEVACIDLAGRARRPPAALKAALAPLLAP